MSQRPHTHACRVRLEEALESDERGKKVKEMAEEKFKQWNAKKAEKKQEEEEEKPQERNQKEEQQFEVEEQDKMPGLSRSSPGCRLALQFPASGSSGGYLSLVKLNAIWHSAFCCIGCILAFNLFDLHGVRGDV